MPKSGAQRVREYRERKKIEFEKSEDERIETEISQLLRHLSETKFPGAYDSQLCLMSTRERIIAREFAKAGWESHALMTKTMVRKMLEHFFDSNPQISFESFIKEMNFRERSISTTAPRTSNMITAYIDSRYA